MLYVVKTLKTPFIVASVIVHQCHWVNSSYHSGLRYIVYLSKICAFLLRQLLQALTPSEVKCDSGKLTRDIYCHINCLYSQLIVELGVKTRPNYFSTILGVRWDCIPILFPQFKESYSQPTTLNWGLHKRPWHSHVLKQLSSNFRHILYLFCTPIG